MKAEMCAVLRRTPVNYPFALPYDKAMFELRVDDDRLLVWCFAGPELTVGGLGKPTHSLSPTCHCLYACHGVSLV